jgi:hypothetical protein
MGEQLLMTTYPYANSFAIGAQGINGATVTAYDVSRFSAQPSLNTPVPGGAADAGPVTSGDAFGFDGAFTIELPTTDLFYLSISYSGQIYWIGPVVGAGAGGSGGGGGGNGEVLNSVSYGPSTAAGYILTTTLAALDTTHLTLSFTVPADGQVTIEADVPVGIGLVGSQSTDVVLAFFEHGTTTLAAPREIVLSAGQTATSDFLQSGRVTYKATVSGLTADASLQWDLAGLSSTAGANIAADDGETGTNSNGPIIITAYGPQTGSGDDLPLTGGTLTGSLFVETEGDAYPRVAFGENGTSSVSSPYVPVSMGTHASGDVGSGNDTQRYVESIADTAFIDLVSFPRSWVTDGTNVGYISSPPFTETTLNTTQYVVLTVGASSSLASSGTLPVKSLLFGDGTLTYTGKTDLTTTYVELTGCTSTGIAAQTDTSERFARATTDSYGNVIELTGDYAGHQVNDYIRFVYNGDFLPNDEYDIILGFFDDVLRNTGSAQFFGADKTCFINRTADGFGNPEMQLTVTDDATEYTFTFDVNGIYANVKLTLGTAINPWGVGYLSGLNLPFNYQTANYTVTASDSTVAMGGTVTATLPDATAVNGRIYTILNVGANVVTVACTSGQTINGAATYTLTTQYSAVTVQSNGTAWNTISGSGSGGSSGAFVPANLQTANYTLVAGDLGKCVEMNSGSALNLTIPENIFSAGDTVEFCQVGTGAVTAVAGSGLTLDSYAGCVVTLGQWATGTIRFRSATEAVVSGALTT